MPNKISKELSAITAYVKKNTPAVKAAVGHHHDGESVRTADYKGHHIVVRTRYVITVDDIPVTGHIDLTNDGQLHYHPVPNASFDSAIDLVKNLIDVFPEDFTASAPHGAPHDHEPHDHTHMAGTMKASRRAKTSRARSRKTRRTR